MRIALICTEKLPVPPVAGGAVQLYIDGITTYLAKDHDITVYGVQHPDLPNEEIRDNIKYIRVSGLTSTMYLNNIKARLENNYDLIHIFNRPRFIISLSEALPDAKFSLSLHNEMFHIKKISDETATLCINKAEFINTVSQYIADTVKLRFPFAEEKLRAVYSGVDSTKYFPGWTEKGAQIKLEMKKKLQIENHSVVLFVGRLSVKKGVHILIKAMQNVIASHPNTALVIVGSKWYGRNEVDDYIRSLHTLSDTLTCPVIYTGFIPPSEIPAYFSIGDVFVCASQWKEPLARVHYEAMAAGLPIITTDRGGNKEVIEGYGNGIAIIDYNNPEEFARQITYLMDNPDIALEKGRKGRQLAEEKYNWERVAAECIRFSKSDE